MKKVPWAWQLQAVGWAARQIISLVVDCGCGKTLAAILIALAKNKQNIVIAPGHRLCSQWEESIKETDNAADVWLYSKPEETKQGAAYQERFEKWLMA
jgi:superfamily II DNA or RNA helicase